MCCNALFDNLSSLIFTFINHFIVFFLHFFPFILFQSFLSSRSFSSNLSFLSVHSLLSIRLQLSSLNLILFFSVDYLGRRRTMMIVNIPYALAWFMMYNASSVWQIFVANSLLGFGIGLMEVRSIAIYCIT